MQPMRAASACCALPSTSPLQALQGLPARLHRAVPRAVLCRLPCTPWRSRHARGGETHLDVQIHRAQSAGD